MGCGGKEWEDLKKKTSDKARQLRRNWLINMETGQSGELGINGSGIIKIHCLN